MPRASYATQFERNDYVENLLMASIIKSREAAERGVIEHSKGVG